VIFRRSSSRARRSQRGAVVVEAAIVFPLILIVVFGMLEAGLYFKDALSLSDVVRDAARAGAAHGNSPDADYWILQTLIEEGSALPQSQIQEVIVYNAASTPTPPNPAAQAAQATACYAAGTGTTTATSSGLSTNTYGINSCNVYWPSDFNIPDSTWQGITPANYTTQVPDASSWPAIYRDDTREQIRGDGTTGPDLLGVWVKITHTWVTGIISTSPSVITDNVVLTIEPQQ
jgi:Flp pilus assembly protein TadG